MTQVSVFDDATAVRPAGEGAYEIQPDQRFAIVTPAGQYAVNGGVLLATMLRAVLAESTHPYPVSTSAHFLRVPRIEPAQVRVTWLKTGRTVAVARASLIQDGAGVIESTVATGALGAGPVQVSASATDGESEELTWTGPPPQLPPVEECVPVPGRKGYNAQVDIRLDPSTAGWLTGQPDGSPEMRAWFGLRDGRAPDAYLLALAVDALPPVVFGLGAISWAPTVELSWHMRAVPAPGLLRAVARSRRVSGGWFDEESEVWDSAGQLVAQSRQLARVGR